MRSTFLAQMACFATVLAQGVQFFLLLVQRDRASFRPTAHFRLRRSLRPFLMSCFLTEQG